MYIGILGGGLSGISVQKFLNHPSEILEKEDRPGGLCRTFCKDGFYYDIGGHILFSKDKKILKVIEMILSPNIHLKKRNNKILYRGRYIKYPFENGIALLDKQDIYECLMGFLNNDHPEPTNFEEWIYHTFGTGISEKYLIPYNKKIWKFPLEKMGIDWVERIPKPPLEDIIKSAIGIETEGYTHQLFFNYPDTGGIESLIRALMKTNANLTTNFTVKKIKKKGKEWIISDGNIGKSYEKIILTIPVKEAVKYMDDVPEEVVQAATNLRHNSVRIVLIGINDESLFDKSAVYIPDRTITAHRICYMGNFSRKNVPRGMSSVIAEISTCKGHQLYKVSDSVLRQKVVDELDRLGLIDRNAVVTTDIKNVEYGYVVYDLDYKKNIEIVRSYFSSMGIELLGRFAEFEYINMDEVIKRSMKMAAKLNKIR